MELAPRASVLSCERLLWELGFGADSHFSQINFLVTKCLDAPSWMDTSSWLHSFNITTYQAEGD